MVSLVGDFIVLVRISMLLKYGVMVVLKEFSVCVSVSWLELVVFGLSRVM